VDEVDAFLRVGDPISIYGTCSAGRPESATFQLFHFATQTF